MKVVIYQCDWCGTQSKPGDSGYEGGEWPKGWSNFEEYGHGDELLCDGCMAAGRRYLELAFERAKAYRLRVVAGPPMPAEPLSWGTEQHSSDQDGRSSP